MKQQQHVLTGIDVRWSISNQADSMSIPFSNQQRLYEDILWLRVGNSEVSIVTIVPSLKGILLSLQSRPPFQWATCSGFILSNKRSSPGARPGY
jgi:hypothetical protein